MTYGRIPADGFLQKICEGVLRGRGQAIFGLGGGLDVDFSEHARSHEQQLKKIKQSCCDCAI